MQHTLPSRKHNVVLSSILFKYRSPGLTISFLEQKKSWRRTSSAQKTVVYSAKKVGSFTSPQPAVNSTSTHCGPNHPTPSNRSHGWRTWSPEALALASRLICRLHDSSFHDHFVESKSSDRFQRALTEQLCRGVFPRDRWRNLFFEPQPPSITDRVNDIMFRVEVEVSIVKRSLQLRTDSLLCELPRFSAGNQSDRSWRTNAHLHRADRGHGVSLFWSRRSASLV